MRIRSRACAVCVLTLAAAWPVVAQVPAGVPFTVNTTSDGERGSPGVAVGPGGRFAVAWRADQQDGDGWGVFARWFDRSGVALTGEVQVNTIATGHQLFQAIDGDGQGNFVIVWLDTGRGVVVRRFDGTGVALSEELVVADTEYATSAAVSANAGGAFVVTWLRVATPDRIVEARRYGADGLPLGASVAVTTFPHVAFREETAVELRDDHSFLVGWGDGEEVFGRLYDSAGFPTTNEFQVSQLAPMSFESFKLDLGSENGGRFRFFWASDINLEEVTTMTRTVAGSGALGVLTDLEYPSEGLPAYSVTGEGEFVVIRVWWFGAKLEGARFDADHSLLGEFEVAQEPGLGSYLASTDLAHGSADSCEFVAVWVNEPLPGGDDPDIRARLFRAGIFADGFDSGDTLAWSEVVP